ncbi:MAG: hypothetical protein Q8M20_04000 [Rhodocyclaceae bacterium]|nr:hypothetical protein [Rhodocyclaceae bacterium]MDZ4213920.1 hypothetical protein [Rhodocyclaceae bacterium]
MKNIALAEHAVPPAGRPSGRKRPEEAAPTFQDSAGMNKAAREYWHQGLLWLNQLSLIIQIGITGCVALLIWLLATIAVSPAPTFEVEFEQATAEGDGRIRGQCQECGMVSTTRSIAHAAPSQGSAIEVTVRMRDGTMRQFTGEHSANWRVGERMVIIDRPGGEGQTGLR